MSLNPAEVERKVRQLDNDMQAVYEMLSAIQGTQTRHTNRLHELGETLGDVSAQISGLSESMTGVDAQVAGLGGSVAGLDQKVTGLDQKVTGLDQKMDTVLELLRER